MFVLHFCLFLCDFYILPNHSLAKSQYLINLWEIQLSTQIIQYDITQNYNRRYLYYYCWCYTTMTYFRLKNSSTSPHFKSRRQDGYLIKVVSQPKISHMKNSRLYHQCIINVYKVLYRYVRMICITSQKRRITFPAWDLLHSFLSHRQYFVVQL